MTDRHQERLYWDAAASDPANIGGIGMPPVEHFLNVISTVGHTGPILDLGCGPGRLAVPMVHRDGESMLSTCRRRCSTRSHPTPTSPPISVTAAPSPTLSPPSGSAGRCSCSNTSPAERSPTTCTQSPHDSNRAAGSSPNGSAKAPNTTTRIPRSGSMGVGFGASAGLELVEAWRDGLVPEWFWACWEKP